MHTPDTSLRPQVPPEPPIPLPKIETTQRPAASRPFHPPSEKVPAGDYGSHEVFAFDIISTLIHK